jgi:hypothetical protein
MGKRQDRILDRWGGGLPFNHRVPRDIFDTIWEVAFAFGPAEMVECRPREALVSVPGHMGLQLTCGLCGKFGQSLNGSRIQSAS